MRREDEISEEDRARVAKVTTSGIHSVERKPFRPLYMMLMLTATVPHPQIATHHQYQLVETFYNNRLPP